MQLIDAYKKLKELRLTVITTNEVASIFSISTTYASKLLERMKKAELLAKLARGVWVFANDINLWVLPEFLTRPYPSYISLHTALYYHGFIEQIPEVIYAVSIARTKRYDTTMGVFSIHHIHEKFFFGFYEKDNIKIATPEKALIDYLYLTPSKTALFRSLPELEIPRTFSITKCKKIISNIPNQQRRTLVEKRFRGLRIEGGM